MVKEIVVKKENYRARQQRLYRHTKTEILLFVLQLAS